MNCFFEVYLDNRICFLYYFVICYVYGIICDYFKIDFGLLKIEKLIIQMYEYVQYV